MMEQCYDGIIISGGQIDVSFARLFLQEQGIVGGKVQARVLAADAGLKACAALDILPAHIVGDFDSAGMAMLAQYKDRSDIEIRTFQPEKDWTDTEIAVNLGIELGWKTIALLGGTGTRLDHVLGNIQVLHLALTQGVKIALTDPHNRITMHDGPFVLKREEQWGKYVSFFAIGGAVEGLSLQGFAYDVENFTLGNVGSRAVSNEIRADVANVSWRNGTLLCIESRD